MGVTIEASAPGRCGIVGNPSDIYGGKVLSCSIAARNTCRLVLGEDDSLPPDTTLWDAATSRYPVEGPVRVEWTSEVPRSSGLAGSTALLAATLACVLRARGDLIPEDPRVMAELVRDIERHEANVMCGYQDAQMVVNGGLQLMDFAGKHPVNPGPLPTLTAIEAPAMMGKFLLVTTGVERLSGSVHGPMAERWLRGDKDVVTTMDRLTLMAPLAASAMTSGDCDTLAALMTENQAMVAALGGSGDAIDALINACLSGGAKAAKLAGAGMGGTVLALTNDAEGLQKHLEAAGYSRFLQVIAQDGLRIS